MITVGIDIGLENTKIAVLKDNEPAICRIQSSGLESRKENAIKTCEEMLDSIGCKVADMIVVTGQGAPNMDGYYKVTEPVADAAYAWSIDKEAKMVVDIGADQTRVIALGTKPKMMGCVLNQKCSACIGITMESIAAHLDMTMEEFSAVNPESCSGLSVNSGCSVFSELGALEHLFNGEKPLDVVGAVINAAAVRVNALLHDKFIPPTDHSYIIGGVAQNKAFINALIKRSGIGFIVPEQPIYACAIGSAIIAREIKSEQ